MRYEFPSNIRSNFEGYDFLVKFFSKTQKCIFDDILLDLSKTEWFEANLTAVLGAILSRLQFEPNTIKIENICNKIKNIFSRNYFLSYFSGAETPDYYATTVRYRKFKIAEEKLFKEYLDRELLSKEVLPEMSASLRKKINESIFEIFNNAILHGDCENIFSCGQYYHQKKRLDFTIVNLGRTIQTNVNEYLRKNLSGIETIQWAEHEGHTTKQSRIPGGLGFSLIKDFLKKNRGKIQIVSADGYWEQAESNETSRSFSEKFKGTIVNLEFNVADDNHYCLTSEIDENNIF